MESRILQHTLPSQSLISRMEWDDVSHYNSEKIHGNKYVEILFFCEGRAQHLIQTITYPVEDIEVHLVT